MGSRALDVNVMRAKDLKDVNFMSRMDVYVIVSIRGDSQKQKTKTSVHTDGGSNPTWNFPVRFTVDDSLAHQNRLSLVFKLKSQRALGDKSIGEVVVPVSDLLNSPADAHAPRAVSYQVITPSGRPQGHLHLSYKFSDVVPAAAAVKAAEGPVNSYPVSGCTSAAVAYPPPPTAGYAYQPPGENMGYPYPPPPQYGGYPPPAQNGGCPPQGYGYPTPLPSGYGTYPAQGGYGYPPTMMQPQKPPKKSKSGMGMGAGLLGGMLGGLLIGDIVSDVAEYGDMYGDFDC